MSINLALYCTLFASGWILGRYELVRAIAADRGRGGSVRGGRGIAKIHSGSEKISALAEMTDAELAAELRRVNLEKMKCGQCAMPVNRASWAQCHEQDCPVVWPPG